MNGTFPLAETEALNTRDRLTSDDFMMPKTGNRMAGSMAAMAKGMTSVIQ